MAEPGRRVRSGSVLVLLAVVGAALRTAPWWQPHRFLGVQEYDDGVYYASGRLLARGLVPYRDVVIVHPPGIALFMTPFAVLGDLTTDPWGLGTARLAVLVVALANLLLVHRLTRAVLPAGSPGPLLAAAAYAVCPVIATSERTVLLEPVVTLLCLLAVTLLLRRPISWRSDLGCGLLLGAAVSVKLFAGTYLVSVLLALVVLREAPRAARVAAGAGLALAATCLPFLLLAPQAFVHDVVTTQLDRPLSGLGGLARLASMVGLVRVPHLLVAVALAAFAVLAVRRVLRATGPARLVLVVLLATVLSTAAAFLLASTYYPHYGAFLVPPLAVLLALLWDEANRSACGLRRGTLGLATGALLSVYAVTAAQDALRPGPAPDLSAVRVRVGGACVFAETASLAIAADVLQTPTAACPSWIDGRGVVYTESRGWRGRRGFYDRGFTENRAWQAAVHDQLTHADFLLVGQDLAVVKEWSTGNRSYALQQFRREESVGGRGVQLWRRAVPHTDQRPEVPVAP